MPLKGVALIAFRRVKMKRISILLPDTIYIKKLQRNQRFVPTIEEYNIYFRNIIQPFNQEWDIVVNCRYGKNLGHCWRITDFADDVDEFNFEIAIYDAYGEKLASKSSKIVMVDRNENLRTRVMFLGDSMTHNQSYVNHVCHTLNGIETVGTRSYDGVIQHEGRGGWSYQKYFNTWSVDFGVSPFTFPKGISGADYYGNMEFIENAMKPDGEVYQYYGYDYSDIKDGQYFTRDKKLYKKTDDGDELITENPEFEFDFAKYIERFNLEKPDIVSVLLGANDLQICPYEESDKRIAEYIRYSQKLIDNIHQFDKNIKVVVNLPVLGAEQYAWGTCLGCEATEKMYRYNIMRASGELLKKFDNRQKENIFISPMIACIDVENGFPYTLDKANKYSETSVRKQSNWVHPSESGYAQMGDALAAVIEHIRSIKQITC